jgi:hypothetical protein
MLNHIKTLRAGDAGYLAKRARNTIDVYHDQKRYVYEKPDQFVKCKPARLEADFIVRF